MRKFFFSFFFLFCSSLFADFDLSPWFPTLGEFRFRPAYFYHYYPDVDQGINPSKYSSHDHLLHLYLGVRFLPNWDAQLGADFASTRKLSWGTRRLGAQVRYLFLDDVAGDPLSLVGSLQLFYVPTRSLRDVSTPYHAEGNIEIGAAIGKEFNQLEDWISRFSLFFGIGSANRGFPWLKGWFSSEFQWQSKHQLRLFLEGYGGLGNRSVVNISRFSGYAKIRHISLDVGVRYRYLFPIWGSLSLQYAYRVYAHAFPARSSTLLVEYCLPFSFF